MEKNEYPEMNEPSGPPQEQNLPTGNEPEAGEDAREEERAFIRRDAEEFRRQYPQVDLAELDADPLFRLFCGSRYGREPLADLYGDYLALAEHMSSQALLRAESRLRRGTGSGGSGGGEALTAAEQRELSEWNRAYPQMKMTAKEFKSR